jgi:hypothetical protein
MRRAWKIVAERAANSAFAPHEIFDALIPALVRDWNDDVPPGLVQSVDDILADQQDLFREQKLSRLESLRPRTAGHALAKVFLDCAIQRATTGEAGPEAPVEAASTALSVRASRGAHQVEEHYCRESNAPRAQEVRARIEQGIGVAPFNNVARQLLKRDPAPSPRTTKLKGLDDGVKL